MCWSLQHMEESHTALALQQERSLEEIARLQTDNTKVTEVFSICVSFTGCYDIVGAAQYGHLPITRSLRTRFDVQELRGVKSDLRRLQASIMDKDAILEQGATEVSELCRCRSETQAGPSFLQAGCFRPYVWQSIDSISCCTSVSLACCLFRWISCTPPSGPWTSCLSTSKQSLMTSTPA